MSAELGRPAGVEWHGNRQREMRRPTFVHKQDACTERMVRGLTLSETQISRLKCKQMLTNVITCPIMVFKCFLSVMPITKINHEPFE